MKEKLKVMEMRRISDVPIGEFTDAVKQMCKELRIPGSTSDYNLYQAVQDEYMKDRSKNPEHDLKY